HVLQRQVVRGVRFPPGQEVPVAGQGDRGIRRGDLQRIPRDQLQPADEPGHGRQRLPHHERWQRRTHGSARLARELLDAHFASHTPGASARRRRAFSLSARNSELTYSELGRPSIEVTIASMRSPRTLPSDIEEFRDTRWWRENTRQIGTAYDA